jgi:hypothetical protein
VEKKLIEINAIRIKTYGSIEKNLLSVSILQEQLQKLTKSKNDLEQK